MIAHMQQVRWRCLCRGWHDGLEADCFSSSTWRFNLPNCPPPARCPLECRAGLVSRRKSARCDPMNWPGALDNGQHHRPLIEFNGRKTGGPPPPPPERPVGAPKRLEQTRRYACTFGLAPTHFGPASLAGHQAGSEAADFQLRALIAA